MIETAKESECTDYRLAEVEKHERHPDAVKRLTEPPRRRYRAGGGELPGRTDRWTALAAY